MGWRIQSRFLSPPAGSPAGWLDCRVIPPLSVSEANDLLLWLCSEAREFEYQAVFRCGELVSRVRVIELPAVL